MREKHLSVGVWNTQWKTAHSPAGNIISQTLLSQSPDVVCITEGHLDQLPSYWYACPSEVDHGYPIIEGRRKVVLFSRNQWRDIDMVGSGLLPPGRFVAATTDTSIGPIRFVGVCIPWRDAHVRTGMRNRLSWEDHRSYLTALREVVMGLPENAIIVGDFNQRVPKRMQPLDIYELLTLALDERFRIVTSGMIADVDELSIDHLACGPDLVVKTLRGLPKTQDGIELSDHFGLSIELTRQRQ